MTTERQIPGDCYVNETGTRQAQIPGGGFVNETVSTGTDLTITGILGTADASGFTAQVDRQLTITGILGAADASGFTASIEFPGGLTVTGILGVATAAGFTANVDRQLTIAGLLATATAAGFNANIDRQIAISGSLGQAIADGFTASLQFVVTATIARPMIDTVAGGWLPNTGSSLYATLDEVTANDADYIYATAATTCKMALNPVVDPLTSSGQVVSYRAWATTGGVIVSLKQGTATIATWTHTTLPASPTTYHQPLSAAECDAITDYSALTIELTST